MHRCSMPATDVTVRTLDGNTRRRGHVDIKHNLATTRKHSYTLKVLYCE